MLAPKSATDARLDSTAYDGVWLPSEGDIAAFEAGLAAHMTKTVPAKNKALPSKLKSYKRQWVGLIAGGKKLIYGNFLCSEHPGWEQHVIMVDDGGDCYFQVFYDVTSREYRDLRINGEA